MPKQENSYRQIVKATSIFGGVQVYNILIAIIRTKFIAIFLGPAGMGISGLLTSTLSLINSFSSLGLGSSAIKNIASANSSGNENKIALVITVFRRLVWITGLLGAIITIVLSSYLSQITFGNHDYTFAFIWISITLLINQLSTSQLVLLQGLRKIKHLAKANLIGSSLGLVIILPIYYKLGINGIVPAIIITSLITFLLSWYYTSKIKVKPVQISIKDTFIEGKGMIIMGIAISLGGLMDTGASYIVKIFISNIGGIAQVGLYNAGFALVNTYVGLIFAAMATDYYPRLSSVANNNKMCTQAINEQSEIALLILAPIVVVFIIFINLVIILLYSSKFIGINEMVYWAALGMFFKAISWSLAFVFLAKGASKVFFWTNLIGSVCTLILNIIGYSIWGLTGLGISFMVSYLIYLIMVYIVSNKKYEFKFSRALFRIFIIQFGIAIFGLISTFIFTNHYLIGFFIITISGGYSIYELDKRIGFKSIIKKIKLKFSKSNL
ncbi:MAG: oligosaccharide flippase family protein [Bacteroidota bacterium]